MAWKVASRAGGGQQHALDRRHELDEQLGELDLDRRDPDPHQADGARGRRTRAVDVGVVVAEHRRAEGGVVVGVPVPGGRRVNRAPQVAVTIRSSMPATCRWPLFTPPGSGVERAAPEIVLRCHVLHFPTSSHPLRFVADEVVLESLVIELDAEARRSGMSTIPSRAGSVRRRAAGSARSSARSTRCTRRPPSRQARGDSPP